MPGEPLLHVISSRKLRNAHCPQCWSRLCAARNFGVALHVGLITAEVDGVVRRLGQQRNRRLAEELDDVNSALKTLGDEIAVSAWRI